MERNSRAGARYTEFLRSHFGVSPRDERLQRPEYVGGCKAPVIISEVLQTSSTDATSAQGNLAGHGLTVANQYCGKYHAEEFGLIIGIMSVMPRSAIARESIANGYAEQNMISIFRNSLTFRNKRLLTLKSTLQVFLPIIRTSLVIKGAMMKCAQKTT